MNNEENIRLFREIQSVVKKWIYSAPTDTEIKFICLVGAIVLVPGVALLHYLPVVGFIVILAAGVLVLIKSRGFYPKRQETWGRILDTCLSAYPPLDVAAWKQLQERVRAEGLTPNALNQWIELEARALWPATKPDWKFLRNSPDEENKRKVNET